MKGVTAGLCRVELDMTMGKWFLFFVRQVWVIQMGRGFEKRFGPVRGRMEWG
jgi:hypothetical protein